MYLIGQISKMTGIAAHTIRYYETIGLLPSSERKNGKDRIYTEQDIRFIQFLISLKETGMSLKDMKELVDLGCLLKQNAAEQLTTIESRKGILEKHLQNLESKKMQIEEVIHITNQKLQYYEAILNKADTKRNDQISL